MSKAKNKATRVANAAKASTKCRLKLPEHVVNPPFKQSKKHSDVDFDGQLKGQGDGLNDLTLDDYIKNRNRYLKDSRAPEGSKAQERQGKMH